MGIIQVNIKALAPLLISERRPDGQFRPSSSFIPGAVWRGAWAQQFINAGETDGELFKQLFTDANAPSFRAAFPARIETHGGDVIFRGSRPLPATAFSCKAESGFPPQDCFCDSDGSETALRCQVKNGVHRHGAFDSLIDRLCCEELGVVAPYLPRCNHPNHQGKSERVESFGGFHLNGQQSLALPTHLTTRVAINRRRKVAEPNLLYSPLVISEASPDGVPTAFCASLVIHQETQTEAIKQALLEFTHLGSGAARGFGQVKVTTATPPANDLQTRLTQFNQLVRRRWNLWQQATRQNSLQPAPDNGTFFTVLLLSDAILRADGWTPTVRLEPHLLGASFSDASPLRCYATAEYRGGWNTAWGYPKDTELVARMSSVYVYHTPRTIDDESLLSALQQLEVQGVGARCTEGFGQVRICDEFHLQVQNPHLGGETNG